MQQFVIMTIAAALGLGAATTATAAELLTNGGFETGTFSGWSATSTQQTSFQASLNDGQNSQIVSGGGSGGPVWYLRNQSANYFGTPQTPITGYSAFNGFDGDAGIFSLRQAFSIAGPVASAILGFSFATQASYTGAARTMDANILALNGSVAFNAFHYVLPFNNSSSWSVSNNAIDITAALKTLGTGTYYLAFEQTIPQSYTGPAAFAIDNVSLSATTSNVPEPGALVILGAGLVGLGVARRRATTVN